MWTVRATGMVNTNPMTSVTVNIDGPSATRATRATTTTGSAMTASTMRLSTISTQPRLYPVSSPMAVPQATPMSVANGATIRMLRAPSMTREATSLPI